MELATVLIAAIGTMVAFWGLLRGEFKSLRGEIGLLRTELGGEIGLLRTELGGEIGLLRTELGGKVDQVFVELLHHVQQGHPHGPPNQAA